MARLARLAGAIVLASEDSYFLVGNPKEPCDWPAHGFDPPEEIDACAVPYQALRTCGPVTLGAPFLELRGTGEALAAAVAERLVIARNGSVSERLWNLVSETSPRSTPDTVDARWLGEVPREVWRIVQDSVLRCL